MKITVLKYCKVLFLVFYTSFLAGQNNLILLEKFENVSCFQCADQLGSFDKIINDNPEAVLVNYHINKPGKDPMYDYNPSAISQRMKHYDLKTIPSVYLNGEILEGEGGDKYYSGAPANLTQDIVDREVSKENSIPFNLDYTFSDDMRRMIFNFTPDFDVETTDTNGYNLSVMVLEKEVVFTSPPGFNGKSKFSHVFRAFVTPEEGLPLSEIEYDENGVLEWNIPIPIVDSVEEIEVIAFIEEKATGKIRSVVYEHDNNLSAEEFVDVSVTAIVLQEDKCDYDKSVKVDFTNNSKIPVTSLYYTCSVNGVSEEKFIGDTIAPGESISQLLENLVIVEGENIVSIKIDEANEFNYGDHLNRNNLEKINVVYHAQKTELLNEGFEGYEYEDEGKFTDESSYVNAIAKVSSSDFGIDGIKVGGYAESDGAVMIDFYTWDYNKYIAKANMKYGVIDLTGVENPHFVFQYSCASDPTDDDIMTVIVSEDCGDSFKRIKSFKGRELQTVSSTTAFYIPSKASQWKTVSVSLADYKKENIVVGFEFRSGYGNNLFIDNVEIANVNSVNILEEDKFDVYPNPTNGLLTIESLTKNGRVNLYDISGQSVYEELMSSNKKTIDISSLETGIYILRYTSVEGSIEKKIFVK